MAALNRLEAYRWMVLTRAFDDHMLAAWRSGRGVGGTFSGRGHEAISVGAGLALGPGDVVAPMHRDLGTYLVRGLTPERIFGNLLGRATGVTGGRDANLHGMGDLGLGIIGFVSHLPQAVPTSLGVAMAFRYRDEARAALTFVGDGGSTSGPFWETVNMAALWKAPLVVVLENNQYAYSTPLGQQMANARFAEKIAPHGVAALRVDGNDVEAVHTAVATALDRARSGGGATVVEAETMRMLGHAVHDGAEYVPESLLAAWAERDPIDVLARRVVASGEADEDELRRLAGEARLAVRAAWDAAESAPLPEPATLENGVYGGE